MSTDCTTEQLVVTMLHVICTSTSYYAYRSNQCFQGY